MLPLDEMKGIVELRLSPDCVNRAISGARVSSDKRIATRSPIWESTYVAGVGHGTTTSGVTADNLLGATIDFEMGVAVELGVGATTVDKAGCLGPSLGDTLLS